MLRVIRSGRSSGQVIVIFAFSLIALIAVVGLAIDSGRAYGVRARLSAAVDAAALSAGRALAIGTTDGERQANAVSAGTRFYNANFANGFLGATRQPPVIPAPLHDPTGFWTVTVRGSATVPPTFMSILGFGDMTVAATGVAVRRDIDVILVLDTSGSLNNPAGTLDKLKQLAINNFVNRFASGNEGDRVGLVSFASGAVTDVPIDKSVTRGFNRAQVVSAINVLTSTGSTAQALGLQQALNEINAIPLVLRSSLRAIVFFSDGAPNDVPATLTRKNGVNVIGTVTGDLYSETAGPATAAATQMYRQEIRDQLLGTYNDIPTLPAQGLGSVDLAGYNGMRSLTGTPVTNNRCNVNKAARNMVENVANVARGQRILVMTIGLGAALTQLEVGFCGYGPSENGGNILKRLSNQADADTYNSAQPTGMYCYAADATQLGACFDRIADALLRLTM